MQQPTLDLGAGVKVTAVLAGVAARAAKGAAYVRHALAPLPRPAVLLRGGAEATGHEPPRTRTRTGQRQQAAETLLTRRTMRTELNTSALGHCDKNWDFVPATGDTYNLTAGTRQLAPGIRQTAPGTPADAIEMTDDFASALDKSTEGTANQDDTMTSNLRAKVALPDDGGELAEAVQLTAPAPARAGGAGILAARTFHLF